MRIDAAKFSRALRAKFPNAKAALRHLGLDENLIDAAETKPAGGSGGTDKLKALRSDLERLISESKNEFPEGVIAKILALLDKHVDLETLDDGHPYAGRVDAIKGGEDDRFAAVKAFLMSRGMTEADAEKAIVAGRDDLPRNAIAGGMGGKLAAADRRLAMDARALASFNALFGAERIVCEPSLAADARHRDRPMSRAAADSFNRMFPNTPDVGAI
jgi:hypothetical protein